MTQIITKGLIGVQDLALGTSTFTRATSTGGTIVLNQINSGTLGIGFPLNPGSPVLLGTGNGSTTAFTLPTSPGPVVLIFLNGVLSFPGGLATYDYALSGTTVTFNTAPPLNSRVIAVY